MFNAFDHHPNEKSAKMSSLNSDGTIPEIDKAIKESKGIRKDTGLSNTRRVKICVCGCALGHHKTSKSKFCNQCHCERFVLHHEESFANRSRGKKYNIIREYNEEKKPSIRRNPTYKYCKCDHSRNWHRLKTIKRIKKYLECENPECNCQEYESV